MNFNYALLSRGLSIVTDLICYQICLFVFTSQLKVFQSSLDVFLSSWVEPVLSRDYSVLLKDTGIGPRGLKTIFLLNSTEHEIHSAHKC